MVNFCSMKKGDAVRDFKIGGKIESLFYVCMPLNSKISLDEKLSYSASSVLMKVSMTN